MNDLLTGFFCVCPACYSDTDGFCLRCERWNEAYLDLHETTPESPQNDCEEEDHYSDDRLPSGFSMEEWS